ncbi:MAG: hypothetical protein GC186_03680 [Rhodobacteraceae bacterium]|nr:hypothetical protein [Paracoccaceae bacterium]
MTAFRSFLAAGVAAICLATGVWADTGQGPGLDIVIRSYPAHRVTAHMLPDAEGRLRLPELPKGRYTLEVADTAHLQEPFEFNASKPAKLQQVINPTRSHTVAPIHYPDGKPFIITIIYPDGGKGYIIATVGGGSGTTFAAPPDTPDHGGEHDSPGGGRSSGGTGGKY